MTQAPENRELGMQRGISRRDLLHGVGALLGSSLLPGTILAERMQALERGIVGAYPPALTGLRGSHVGSFEVAHALARDGRRDWGPIGQEDDNHYDLAIVGAGISGLAAAHFYRKTHPNARLLILDNHGDFGGHATRNEFTASGRTLIGYGGSQTLEQPSSYPAEAGTLLADLGVNLEVFDASYDHRFFKRNNLGGAVFFDRRNWGVDRLVPYDLGALRYTLPLARNCESVQACVAAMPLGEAARAEMLRLLISQNDVFPGQSQEQRLEILESISYEAYLRRYIGITEPEVFKALGPLATDLGAGIDAVPAIDAISYIGLPGYAASGLAQSTQEDPYIHHFPDGNASVARLLVRRLIPDLAPGSTMEDVVRARFDYARLDCAASPVRLRLNSTVVDVRHDGNPADARSVVLRYVRDGRHERARAKQCVLACYNAMIPAICPELPETQREALGGGVKIPVVYTNVQLNNWRSWRKLGVGAISAPGSYHVNAMLDFPVTMGGYEFSAGPDEPIVVHLERFPHSPDAGLSLREHARLGRYELLSTPFATIERNTREQLAAMLGGTDFDPARDIEAITVNRWPHGYAARDWLNDDYYDDPDDPRYWFVRGRRPFGRIVIANSDAGASATIETAIAQAYRAVGELG